MLTVRNSSVNTVPIFATTAPNAPAPAPLSAEQTAAVAALHAQVPELIAGLGELSEGDAAHLLAWADPACVRRFLAAAKWDAGAGAGRLAATLAWRAEYRPHAIAAADVAAEATSGRSFVSGADARGRPLLFLVPRQQRAPDSTPERALRFSVFMLERAIKAMPAGVETLALVIDYEGVTRANATPMSVSIKYLSIFGAHYPERLGIGIMINPSWYLPVLLTCLGPFMDPVTKSKIHFVNLKDKSIAATGANKGTGGWVNILDCINADQLPTQYGGTFEFEYSHEDYWPRLLAL